MPLTRDDLTAFLRAELGVDPSRLGDQESLIDGGYLDSILLLSVFQFLRRSCGLTIEPADVTLDNFDTIERILAFANRDA